jgi:hypothetical protein
MSPAIGTRRGGTTYSSRSRQTQTSSVESSSQLSLVSQGADRVLTDKRITEIFSDRTIKNQGRPGALPQSEVE